MFGLDKESIQNEQLNILEMFMLYCPGFFYGFLFVQCGLGFLNDLIQLTLRH